MASRYCSSCGRPVPAGATFCPSCGAAVALPPGGGTASAPYAYVPGIGGAASGPTPMSRSSDLAALSQVSVAALLALASGAVSFALLVLDRTGGTGLGLGGSVTSVGAVSLPSPWLWTVVLVSELVFLIPELLLLREAFHRLAGVEGRFGTPATLALLALVGTPVALLGAGLLLDGLYRAAACAGAGNRIPAGCLPVGEFWGGVALAVLGGLVALVGFIGILLGIWRLGSRYDSSLFKVGAVFLLFPLLNLAGAILILVGARLERARVERLAPTIPPAV